MPKRYFDNPGPDGAQRPIALSHRGFAPDGRENTLPAMAAALDLGFAYLEIDVRTTRDGVVMVFHDERLERVTDGSGRLADHSLAELSAVRVRGSEPIPTLEEVLERWPGVRLNIDIKDDSSIQPFADLVEKHGVHDRVLVAAFSDRRRLRVLRKLSRPTASSAGMAVNALIKALSPLKLTRLIAKLARVDCVQVPLRFRGLRVADRNFIRRCNEAEVPVHVWTINDRATMEELLDDGASGLVSDRADLLAEVMVAWGAWPQYN
ncbi:glycerophosphoryl diester phosphodiesterase [Arthrobacter pigmenti]|uniref:Glycerophosphoryl diester phosphodiesterase n=1 Tax=Arthrobacter pigmenti TaxID=271432 RepID=A0A846RM48_9MICC|nr:glycerophosphoryl diester phosphodiesterase [Arthrobacter pigmenti]